MNVIDPRMRTGTIGEILVQLRLLQYGVQAAPPIKDSGNDLIAINGRTFRAISVKTTTNGRYNKPEGDRVYDVLAVVSLSGGDREIWLDQSDIFLIPHEDVAAAPTRCSGLGDWVWSAERVANLFGAPDQG
jgi:hypothetical protein